MGTLIYLERYGRARLPFAGEKDLLPAIGQQLAPLFHPGPEAGRAGLYLVSANAGFQSSLSFWADAKRSGVAVANPELFPWTLANAPCGWLAREFQVTGPNFTYTGGNEALSAALSQACEHLRTATVDTAWVIAIDFAQTPGRTTHVAAMRLGSRHEGTFQFISPSGPVRPPARSGSAARTLAKAVRACEKGGGEVVLPAGWRLEAC